MHGPLKAVGQERLQDAASLEQLERQTSVASATRGPAFFTIPALVGDTPKAIEATNRTSTYLIKNLRYSLVPLEQFYLRSYYPNFGFDEIRRKNVARSAIVLD